jgi:hypothetical protein
MLVVLAVATALLAGTGTYDERFGSGQSEAVGQYAKLPVSFIPNRGQADPQVRYHAQGSGYSFSFTDDKAVISLTKAERTQALALSFMDANPRPRIEPLHRAPGEVNYLTGKGHQTHIPMYAVLVYRDLWPGIDMVFKGRDGRLVYEFHVSPGADPRQIRLAWQGASGLSLGRSGDLEIKTLHGVLTDARPRSYQESSGHRVAVSSAFTLTGSNSYRFSLGRYDRREPLVIDPSLAYSTYVGSGPSYAIAVDSAGNVYITGANGPFTTTSGKPFPTTPGAYDTTPPQGGTDAFVTKLSADGGSLVYSTYLGGNDFDEGHGVAVDSSGHAYLTGWTQSTDFPTTPGAFLIVPNTTLDPTNAFVTKLSADGSSLDYSTYLGGGNSDRGVGIAIDPSGHAYVTGSTASNDFPTTLAAYDTSLSGQDAFVTELSASGSLLLYSTYLGGGGSQDYPASIEVDSGESAYVTGSTAAADFPTTPGAYDTTINGPSPYVDAYVTKLNPGGSSLAYSSFLGGATDDSAYGIAVDSNGSAYVTGTTGAAGFPTTPGAYDTSSSGGDSFVTKLSQDGSSLAYSTYLGGSGYDQSGGIAVDGSGNAYIGGQTSSRDFPITPGAADTTNGAPTPCQGGDNDLFVTRLSAGGGSLAYSSYLGANGCGNADEGLRGIAVDSDGAVYVTGYAGQPDFPTTPGAYDPTHSPQFLYVDQYGSFYDYPNDRFVTKLYTAGSALSSSQVIVKKDAVPDSPFDFSFTGSGGASTTTFQLDDDQTLTPLSDTGSYGPLAPGSGYSITENATGWDQSATCSNGSTVDDITLAAGESVVCTFVNTEHGYARPQYAGRESVRLVPAFNTCFSGNASHNPPLSLPSCAQPTQPSHYLTFDAPDRPAPFNQPATGNGLIDLQVFCIDGASPPCKEGSGQEQDVRITTAITGIRCKTFSGGCTGAGATYNGEVLGKMVLQITDRMNGPDATSPGTTNQFPVTWGVQCPSGTCNSTTTVNAVGPFIVVEGKRAVWKISDVQVLDGGANGTLAASPSPGGRPCPPACVANDDEAPFLRQGLFVP